MTGSARFPDSPALHPAVDAPSPATSEVPDDPRPDRRDDVPNQPPDDVPGESTGHGADRGGWWARLRALAAGPMLRNAAGLYGTTVVTSALGFAFWWVAARLWSPETVGVGSALLSTVQLLGAVATVGLNTLLIAELGRMRDRAAALVTTAVACAAVVALVVGTTGALVLREFSAPFRLALAPSWAVAVFAVGVALTSVAVVLDDACVGVLRAERQLRRNAVFAAAKLVALPLAAVVPLATGSLTFIAVWIVGIVVSLPLLAFLVREAPDRPRFRRSLVRRFGRTAMTHHWLNVAMQAPRLLLPVVATALVGPREAAGFYTALLLVTFVLIIPSQLSTVLFALRPGDHEGMRREVRTALGVSWLVALLSVPAIALLGGTVLRVFHPDYDVAAGAMILLGLVTAPWAVKSLYVAVVRVQGRLTLGAAVVSLGAILEVVGAVVGARAGGLTGLSVGYLLAVVVEALLLWGTVRRAIRPPQDAGPATVTA